MSQPHKRVKARRYDASGRRERARASQARILRCAETMFLRDGYATTTIVAIAAASGVSPESIYKTFGGKAGLVRAIQRAGLAGAGDVPAPERSDALSAREQDPDTILRNWAKLATEVAPRTAPIMLLVRSAAAGDPQMGRLLEEVNRQRLDRMAQNARRLVRRRLREGMTIGEVRDVLFTFTAPEIYESLVLHRGWSLDAYGDFLYRGMRGELLP